jgi:hypothetical protein
LIYKIGDGFMMGCTNFNKNLDTLITDNLKEIGANFLDQCSNFNQYLPFELCTLL